MSFVDDDYDDYDDNYVDDDGKNNKGSPNID